MKPCRYETIFSTPNGNIYHLIEANLYQIDFMNMVITIKKENIQSLYQFLICKNPQQLDSLKVLPSNKILIQHSGFWGCYAFSKSEFIELRELVIGSYSLIIMEEEIRSALTPKQ